jgi:hypothetical protein
MDTVVSKDARRKYGIEGRHIKVDRLYTKRVTFDHPAWKVIAVIGLIGTKRIALNVYIPPNGKPYLGEKCSQTQCTKPVAEDATLNKRLASYQELPQSEWGIFDGIFVSNTEETEETEETQVQEDEELKTE